MLKRIISQSSSHFTTTVLFAKNPDIGLHICIDSWGNYRKTIKNRYPLPLIKETLNLLGTAKIYTKMDIRGAYNLLPVKAEDERKQAF